jgi:site-specific DNA-methyltransferase (adenine-specific)
MIAWVYGSGFPKSLDVSKAIDKAAGAEREVVGVHRRHGGGSAESGSMSGPLGTASELPLTAPATPEAQQWAGWGTALKPALEPITMARKPFPSTVAANVLQHGTGALNVDGCRVGTEQRYNPPAGNKAGGNSLNMSAVGMPEDADGRTAAGRWPANLIHDGSDEVVGLFPLHLGFFGDSGSAARFFYTAKATKAERQGVTHPTVKPLDLMAYLCRLVTPPGGIVLDPFMGSGTTIKAALSEGFNAIGIERDPAYFAMAQHRMDGAQLGLPLTTL